MNTKQILVDLLVLSFGIFAALMAVYYVLKNEIETFFDIKNLDFKKENRTHLLPLRLQAHERLIVFVDLIKLAQISHSTFKFSLSLIVVFPIV